MQYGTEIGKKVSYFGLLAVAILQNGGVMV